MPLGTYRGLRFGLVLRPQFPTEVYLEGKAVREDTLSREHAGPRAVLNALERLAEGFGFACDGIRQNLAIAEGQLRDYQARLGKPFIQEGYQSELTSLRDQLKAALSGVGPKDSKEGGPSTSDLAGRIKAIRAAHSVEGTPVRVRQSHSSAEEPITTRIRRRAQPPESMTGGEDPLSPSADDGIAQDRVSGGGPNFERRVESGRLERRLEILFR